MLLVGTVNGRMLSIQVAINGNGHKWNHAFELRVVINARLNDNLKRLNGYLLKFSLCCLTT
jgi:hypothetical protein